VDAVWYTVAIVVGSAIFMFAITWPQHIGAVRRKRAITAFAASLGYSFRERADDVVAHGPGTLPTFRLGTKRQARNVVRVAGDEGMLFDDISWYSYGRRANWWRKTVYVVPARLGSFPDMHMRPTAFGDELFVKLAGWHDIDFDDDPQFSKRYVLRGADEAQVRNMFTSGSREFISRERDWHAESGGNWLAVWRSDTLFPVDQLDTYIAQCREAVSYLRR
jgi:hypothetical protein